MQVIIKSIAKQHILNDEDFKWLKSHLNTPLRVMSIYWDRPEHGGNLWHLTIYKDGKDSPISLFVEYMEMEYELLW